MPKFILAFLKDKKMYVSVNVCKSKKRVIKSEVTKRSVLAPLLFAIYINELPNGISNATKLFAEGLKLIANAKDHRSIEKNLRTLETWQKSWLLPFNIEKCKLLHLNYNNNPYNNSHTFNHHNINDSDEKIDQDFFLTIIQTGRITDYLISKTNKIIGWVTRNLLTREKTTMNE